MQSNCKKKKENDKDTGKKSCDCKTDYGNNNYCKTDGKTDYGRTADDKTGGNESTADETGTYNFTVDQSADNSSGGYTASADYNR